MFNDAIIFRNLVKMICAGDLGSEEKFKPHSAVINSVSDSWKIVMQKKIFIANKKWLSFIDTCYRKMFDSHEMYLTFIMFACVSEHKCHRNIFESFISVCAVVHYLITQTRVSTTVDFSELELDIFMAFYQTKMKKTFYRCGGLNGLIDYIRGHPFAKLISDTVYFKFDVLIVDLNNEKFQKEFSEVREIIIDPDEVEHDEISISLAQNVLSATEVKLLPLPSENDLIRMLVVSRKKEAIIQAKLEGNIVPLGKYSTPNTPVTSPECANSNSDSDIRIPKTKHGEIKEDNIESYEKVIQAVIKHNHSKASSEKKANNPKQEADRILNHLKETIKSLIKVLDEYDKE